LTVVVAEAIAAADVLVIPNPSAEGLVAVPVPPAAFAEDLDLDACVVVEH
jgi:hypothetical protein